jgi:hypothetical protein
MLDVARVSARGDEVLFMEVRERPGNPALGASRGLNELAVR